MTESESTSTSAVQAADMLCLDDWGLPDRVTRCYKACGITRLFQWQAECLLLPGVLSTGRNLVYSAPTSAGKTLVAEMLVLKRVLDTGRRALIILPFVALAREKMISLQKNFRSAGIRVEGYMGTISPPAGGIDRWNIAVCTLEKANSLINRLVENGDIDKIGTIVVDELHTVGDASRGYLLELLLSKLLFIARNRDCDWLQIIGMSATVSNVQLLADWLKAALYTTTYRPVPLREHLLHKNTMVDSQGRTVRTLCDSKKLPLDQDFVAALCLEPVLEKKGVLVFCVSRSWTENLAEMIAKVFHRIGSNTKDRFCQSLRDAFDAESQRQFLIDFRKSTSQTTGGKDTLLVRLMSLGVAFHHAGLTMEERSGVERAFVQGHVRVLTATSTLSAGVNLPAARVIIRSLWGIPQQAAVGKNSMCLTPAVYKQMVGRAGRKGIDTQGESILMCNSNELDRARYLLTAPIAPIYSALLPCNTLSGSCSVPDSVPNGPTTITLSQEVYGKMRQALLEVIAGQIADSRAALVTYLSGTLLGVQLSQSSKEHTDTQPQPQQSVLHVAVQNSIDYFQEHDFVSIIDDKITCTQLGAAAVASALGPQTTLEVYAHLLQARRTLVLSNELHLVFLVTPTFMQETWDKSAQMWFAYYDMWCALPPDMKHVGLMLGLSEQYLLMRTTATTSKEDHVHRLHMRFYTALALHELVTEQPLSVVANKYQCNRGFLQSLQTQASTFAGMVVTLCDRVGWPNLKQLLSGFAERLAFGVRRDLCELVRIDGIDGSRARCFHEAGYKTMCSLAQAPLQQIACVLKKAVPFQQVSVESSSQRPWLSGHPDMPELEAAALVKDRAQLLFADSLRQLGLDEATIAAKQHCTRTPTTKQHSRKNRTMAQGRHKYRKSTHHRLANRTNRSNRPSYNKTHIDNDDGHSQSVVAVANEFVSAAHLHQPLPSASTNQHNELHIGTNTVIQTDVQSADRTRFKHKFVSPSPSKQAKTNHDQAVPHTVPSGTSAVRQLMTNEMDDQAAQHFVFDHTLDAHLEQHVLLGL